MQGYTTPNADVRIHLKQEVEMLAILPAELDLLQALFLEYCNDITKEVPCHDNPPLEQVQNTAESSNLIKLVSSK